MRSVFRHVLAIASLGSILLTSGCGSSLQSWIVATRNHQGDLALDNRHYKEAVLAYRLAMQIDPTDEHAKTGFVESEADFAEMLYAQSHYDDALEELAAAAKIDPQSVRVAGLRTDVEGARIKKQIVLSNYPTYQVAAHSIAEAFVNLRSNNNEVLYRLGRFGHTYDTTDLTSAIRGSMDMESESGKLTTRLLNLRSAVSVGSVTPDSSAGGGGLTSNGSILPLP